MADYENRRRNDRWSGSFRNHGRNEMEHEYLPSGRKPGQEHDYGRAMLEDMRRYARGDRARANEYGANEYGTDEYGTGEYRADQYRTDERGTGEHRGRGPRGYVRSDSRILEDVNDCLTEDPYIDASDIEVSVNLCEVTLDGTVDSRMARRRAEDIIETISGVRHVQNNLRVRPPSWGGGGSGTETGTAAGASAMADLGRGHGARAPRR